MTIINIATTLILLFWPIVIMTSPMMLGAPGAVNDKGTILSVIAVLYYPVYIFFIYTLFRWSYFGYSSGMLLLISFIVITSGLFIFGYVGLLQNAIRGIASSGYSVTSDSAYYDGKAIKDSDPTSFVQFLVNMQEYARDAQSVFYNGKSIEGADPTSFQNVKVHDFQSDYWIDQNHVYYSGTSLKYAKPQGFTVLDTDSYSVYTDDQNSFVYHYGKMIENADAGSFVILSSHLSKDQHNVYYATDLILSDAGAKNFSLLSDDSDFGIDKNHVYDIFVDRAVPIEGADPKTIQILQRGYLKDKTSVYYRSGYEPTLAVQGADTESFEVTDYDEKTDSEAKDNNGYYMQGKRLPKTHK